MPMAKVLQQLEDRLEELLARHDQAKERIEALTGRVAELEARLEETLADKAALQDELAAARDGNARVKELETELAALRRDTASRLEKVLVRIDRALEQESPES